MEKVSVFIKIRVLFWPEISALGVLFNFDNERMRPPKYSSAPPGGGGQVSTWFVLTEVDLPHWFQIGKQRNLDNKIIF